MNKPNEFGRFIAFHRIRLNKQSKDLANQLAISVSYLSQLEHGIRFNPNPELMEALVIALQLNSKEKKQFYDLYSYANGTLSPDISEYITSNKVIIYALRTAMEYNASNADWVSFAERIKSNFPEDLESKT